MTGYPVIGAKVKRRNGSQTWTGTIQHARPLVVKGQTEDYRIVVVADADAPIPGAIIRCKLSECEANNA